MRRARGQAGFTLVEVMVAIFILAIGLLAALRILDASTRSAYNAQRNQAAVTEAQRQLEALRRFDYAELALTAAPATSTDPDDVRSRVSGASFDLDREPGAGAEDFAELVVNGVSGVSGGTVDPGPETFVSGSVRGKVYRFVVWQDDPRCSALICPGSKDLKRAVVAIELDDVAVVQSSVSYIELQSDFINPFEGVLGETPPVPTGEGNTAQQFWLHDTTCNHSSRQTIGGSHYTQNTSGGCPAGEQQPLVDVPPIPGAPDLMSLEPPPDPAPNDPADPPIYDYSQDVATAGAPEQGLQMLRPPLLGCEIDELDDRTMVHRWVTPEMPHDYVMEGKVSLDFWTRRISTSSGGGGICAYLFVYEEESGGVVSLTPIASPRQFNAASWPSSEWGNLSFTIQHGELTLSEGKRLMLAITVDRSYVADGLMFLYDHPDHSSRLEVETSTPIQP